MIDTLNFDPYDILAIKRLSDGTKITHDDHWLWQRSLTLNGYGKFWYKNKTEETHRISAHILLGMPLGVRGILALHRDALCRFRNCWNPDHLYIGGHNDNHRDRRLLKTHCPSGHAYDEENTYIKNNDKGSYRICRICQRENIRLYRKR